MQYTEFNLETGALSTVVLSPEEEAAYLSNVPPPPDPRKLVLDQIETMEKDQMLPRITREFMLLQFQAVAAAQGVDPMTNAAYVKLKQFDDQIATLRASI
jgi:hypothetical protein